MTTKPSNTRITLKNVRVAYAQGLFEARAPEGGGEPKFNAAFLFDKSHPALAELSAAVQKAAVARWGEKAPEILKQLKASDRLPVHDGATKPNSAGYAGNYFVNAGNKIRPLVVDVNPKNELTMADGKPYSGCYVNAILEIWAQDNKFGKRVNAALAGVQFVRDGERLAGGSVASADDFEPLPGSEAGAPPAESLFA